MTNLTESTYSQAGLSKDDVLKLVFTELQEKPLTISDIYDLVNKELEKKGYILSYQGKQTLNNLFNSSATKAGFIHPKKGKFELTRAGKLKFKEIINDETDSIENDIDAATGDSDIEETKNTISNTMRGELFEKYILGLLKRLYPEYAWYHQGINKNNERGLDLIGSKLEVDTYRIIGVQVKNIKADHVTSDLEWLKFLAGCYTRRIDNAIFVTTGKLSSNQWREAGEAHVMVISGIDEIDRIAKQYSYVPYKEPDDNE